ncbi:hypothetical protein V6Z11_A06G073500 [Gossypium hirsutum]
MENRFRLRISRMFRSSFGSCRTRKVSDVAEKVVFSLENHNKFRCMEPSSMSPPKVRPLPSICKPRYPESHQPTQDTRRKVSACYPPFLLSATDFDGRKCPPASPISPLNLFSNCEDFGLYEKKKSLARKKKNNKRVHVKCGGLAVKMKPKLFSLQELYPRIQRNRSGNILISGEVQHSSEKS